MSSLEIHLTLAHARAGMMLARSVLDAQGQILMAQSTELSDPTLTALHRRDITELWVLDPQPQTADLKAQEGALRQHHKERLTRLFRHIGESADDHYLMDIMTRYRGLEPS